jgi:hypothetical protein
VLENLVMMANLVHRVYLVILGCLVVKEYKEIWERKAKRARKEGKDFQ